MVVRRSGTGRAARQSILPPPAAAVPPTPRASPAPPDRDRIAADWRRRGYSCATFEDPPGRAWENFRHDCNERVAVLRGRLRLVIEGREQVLAPGGEAFIPRGALHSVYNIGAGRALWLYGYDRPAS